MSEDETCRKVQRVPDASCEESNLQRRTLGRRMVEGYPQPSVSFQTSFDPALMPVATARSYASRRGWPQTTQESVNVLAAFVVTVSVVMIIVVTVSEFASVRLTVDAQHQRAFEMLTLVKEFE